MSRGSFYGGPSHQVLGNTTDLATLPQVSDDVIVSCLRERFLNDQIYTRIGSHALVALNPHKYVASNSDAVMLKYAAEYRDTSGEKTQESPHIFQLANYAYYHMRRTGQDQSILFTGETCSGKSENRRLAIKSILELSVSNPGKKGAKLSQQVPSAEFVLESFGNARTLQNPNASRFGKYTELQFTERGRLCGVKTLDYYLERNRIAGALSGERNFHIFYYLVAGASNEERHHLKLAEKGTYRYLGNGGRANLGKEDDGARFEQLKQALKSVGLSKRHVAQTCQLLAAIIHLGQIEFTIDRHRNQDAAVVRNLDVLQIVADFLGVQFAALESALSYRTKMVKKELCTVFLDPEGASDNRDDLAKTLYSLLFAWLNEYINSRLCRDDFNTFIGLFDLPGPQNLPSSASRSNSLDQFCVNFANERLQHWIQRRLFESHTEEYNAEGIARLVPQVSYFDNSECVRLMANKPGGLIHIMDDQARRQPKKTDHTMVEAFGKRWGNHSSFKVGTMDRSGFPSFTIHHYSGPVMYSAESFLERNSDALNPDFVSLLRGANVDGPHPAVASSEFAGSVNPFVRGLFSAKAIATQAHPRHEETIVAAQQPVKPMRTPSTRRKKSVRRMPTLGEEDKDDDDANENTDGGIPCVAGEFRAALDTLFETVDETQGWFVFCINPNDAQLPNQLEGRGVKAQVRNYGLPEVARRSIAVFEASMTPEEFCERYKDQIQSLGIIEGSFIEQVQQVQTSLGLQEKDIVPGQHKVFLSHPAFHKLEDHLRAYDVEETKRNRLRDAEAEAGLSPMGLSDPYAPYRDQNTAAQDYGFSDALNASNQALPLVANAAFQRADMYNDEYDERRSLQSEEFDGRSQLTSHREETSSNFGSESYAPSRNMFQNAEKNALPGKGATDEILDGEVVEEIRDSSARRRWLVVVWMLTFWCPNIFLKWFGRMKRMDIRQAWREKLAINMIIWFICACGIFVIAVLGNVICPTEHVFSTSELQSHSFENSPNNAFTSIRGEVMDLTFLARTHLATVSVVPTKSLMKYSGTTADIIFPVQVSALCNGINGEVDPYVVLNSDNATAADPNAQYHDFRVITNDPRPDWYFENMVIMRATARKGWLGLQPNEISNMASQGKAVAIYNGLVYDLSSYISHGPALGAPPGQQLPNPGGIKTQFMDESVVQLFQLYAGSDITRRLDGLNLPGDELENQKICLRNLFTIGRVDHRDDAQCLFSKYILLALSIVLVSVIGFKFLAALQFGSARAPEDHDKFVICQVPCYTEGEESMRNTIDSIAKTKYDDKRKLLFIICDGMIVGSGNDRPTPRIVLDILGADPNQDPEPLSFLSLGEGAKQHNMGKVYSGLYECAGHVVPYLVVVKVGKPSERQRPGNRGKRDSQMVIMHFFNKVHFNAPMNPLELEVYHQIKNVIGVNPTFYEYLLTVDADTTVTPLSLNRLVSAMINDKKVIGLCGETALSNSKKSIITMMQVYEYFISHHLAKAFESLFGSVTCLPGCFSMYRLRTPDTHKPLFVSNQVIHDYSENRVDTLHVKNLLHLGEDRYLTTLLLRHFPNYKTIFVREAQAYTVAPEDWSVLLSQRRRWINSTIHNLAELVFLEKLCGFCCFSMRFVVFIDLLSTVIQPITIGYLAYLFYQVIANQTVVPTLSIVMIAAIYGLQALIFLFRRKWDMIGWMVFYILAIPIFSFALPLYAFWKMDDFSWGATRLVLGEKGKKLIVHDEGKFDPRSIPLKSWNDYENELWDKESNHSIGSWVPPAKEKDGYDSHTASIYGRETFYEPALSRSYSPAPSYVPNPLFAGPASGRNTPTGSFIHQPAASRPMTSYFDNVQIPRMGTPENFSPGLLDSQQPTDATLQQAVQEILRNADLNTITKRGIRGKLEEHFGMDLSSRKATINGIIDGILLNPS